MFRALPLVVVAACGSSSSPSRPAAPSGEWHCFVAAPDTPTLRQGNVTHAKRRVAPDRVDIVNRHVQRGVPGVTRLTVPRAGDHYRGAMGEATVTVKLLTPDGLHTELGYADPSGWTFTDEILIDAGGMRITSTDASVAGPVKTTLHFVRAECATVDAAVAADER